MPCTSPPGARGADDVDGAPVKPFPDWLRDLTRRAVLDAYDVELMSGDLFVFGGACRFAFHGVPKAYPGTADPALGLTGRLNITTRVTGLSK